MGERRHFPAMHRQAKDNIRQRNSLPATHAPVCCSCVLTICTQRSRRNALFDSRRILKARVLAYQSHKGIAPGSIKFRRCQSIQCSTSAAARGAVGSRSSRPACAPDSGRCCSTPITQVVIPQHGHQAVRIKGAKLRWSQSTGTRCVILLLIFKPRFFAGPQHFAHVN